MSSQLEPRAHRVIHPRDRMWWDAFVLTVVLFTAFEMPYDWLVGWSKPAVPIVLDVAFVFIFGGDMVLNARTVRHRSFGGFWGWRTLLGVVWPSVGPKAHQRRIRGVADLLTEPAAVMRGYVTSGWFIVDLLSTIPWGLLAVTFQFVLSLRLMRLLRLARLLRFFRLSKAVILLERVRRLAPSVPSLERLVLVLLSVPWVAHIHACLLCFFERNNPQSFVTYSSAFHTVFTAFTTQDEARVELSTGGFWVGVSAVAFSLVFVSVLTGTIAAFFTGLELKKERRSRVRLTGHTVILGWNYTVSTIIEQLVRGGQSGRPGDIVVLSDVPTHEMWQKIEESLFLLPSGHLTLIQGSIYSIQNLLDTNLARARQAIVVGHEPQLFDLAGGMDLAEHLRRGDAADMQVLKALLACYQASRAPEFTTSRRRGPLPVVAAVQSEDTADILRRGIPRTVAADRLAFHVVDTSDILSRCIAQVVGEPRMAQVFHELFGGGSGALGDGIGALEIQVIPPCPEQVGRSFGSCWLEYELGIPIGYFDAKGKLVLNSKQGSDADGHPLGPDDYIVLVARSTGDLIWSPGSATVIEQFAARRTLVEPRQVLLLGSGAKSQLVLALLPEFLPEGSTVYTELELSEKERGSIRIAKIVADSEGRFPHGPRQMVTHAASDALECETVVIVAEQGNDDTHDVEILMTLTALHATRPSEERRAVVELLDPQNLELAQVFGRPVAIVSAELVSNYLVQLAADPRRGEVFRDLLDPEGSEIYLRPARRYVLDDDPGISFAIVQSRARALHEVAIGYATRDGLVLCPSGHERERMDLMDIAEQIVVIAEERLRNGT